MTARGRRSNMQGNAVSSSVRPCVYGKAPSQTAGTRTCGPANNNILWQELGGGRSILKIGEGGRLALKIDGRLEGDSRNREEAGGWHQNRSWEAGTGCRW